MNNIKWYYPVSLAEVALLLEKKGTVLHGGGTNLSSRDMSGVSGIICLKNLDLDYVIKEKDKIDIGSMSTYAGLVAALKKLSPHNLLVKSLSNAANTPCRNRITIGGSIAYVPKWSDLAGALLALDADVILAGKNEGKFTFSEYLEKPELQENTLVCSVRFEDKPHLSTHYRETKTANDMPLFTITVLLTVENMKISASKVFVVGTKERITELKKVENYLAGKNISELNDIDIQDLVNVKFIGNRITDPEYLSFKVKIETARAVRKALEAA